MEESFYDTYQVCINGHGINDSLSRFPDLNDPFCSRCGARTITACESCGTPIRGLAANSRYIGGTHVTPPPPEYCHRCGKPYPWTTTKLQAVNELIDEADELTMEQKETLKQDVQDLAKDSPRTELAANRAKKRLAALGGAIGNGLRALIADIASETARKILTGQ